MPHLLGTTINESTDCSASLTQSLICIRNPGFALLAHTHQVV